MDKNKLKQYKSIARKNRVRKKIRGTAEKPRLSICRSLKHIYVQAINDNDGITIVSSSSMDKELKMKLQSGGNKTGAFEVGKLLGERLLSKGIANAVFDKGAYKYHGRVKALAEGARASGLKF